MYALKLLHKKLSKACPCIHQKRLAILVLATHALLIGQRLSLTQLGRRLQSSALTKHKIKRIDRLLGNSHLHQERQEIYRFISQQLIDHSRPLIIVDWSDLTKERDYHLLRASIPVGGRALTLYEEVHPQKNLCSDKIHRQFLRRLESLLPAGCCPIVITDAGFRNPWFKAICDMGWDYVGRVRNRDMLKPKNKLIWKPCKYLYQKAQYKPRYLGQYTVVRSNPIDTHLYLVKQRPKNRHRYNDDGTRTTRGQSEKMAQRQKEPLLISTSLQGSQQQAQRIIKLYKNRMQIEEAFRDTKSKRLGFSIRESLTRNLERLEILLLIGALATFMAWLLGVITELKQWHRRYQSNTNNARRVLSTFFIGCQVAADNQLTLRPSDYTMALNRVKTDARRLNYD